MTLGDESRLPQKKRHCERSVAVPKCIAVLYYFRSMERGGATYILTNIHHTVLYVGVTSDLLKRMYEHKNKLYPGFSAKYNTDKLVHYELFSTIEEAISREKQ